MKTVVPGAAWAPDATAGRIDVAVRRAIVVNEPIQRT
jgi:hypothetical protein